MTTWHAEERIFIIKSIFISFESEKGLSTIFYRKESRKAWIILAATLTAGATLCRCSKDDSTDAAATKPTMTVNGGASFSLLGGDTSAAKLTAYEFLMAKSGDCSDPVSIFKADHGKEVDMMTGPEIGSGQLDAGTYNCVIMVMSDKLSFTPKTTNGACIAGTAVDLDVFQPQGETYRPTATLPDGTSVEGTASEQKIAVYISTLSTSTGGGEDSNPMEAPTTSKTTNGIILQSALEVTKDTTGTMIMDTAGKVEPNGDNCDMQPPTFGFE